MRHSFSDELNNAAEFIQRLYCHTLPVHIYKAPGKSGTHLVLYVDLLSLGTDPFSNATFDRHTEPVPDSKVHEANMGPIWDRKGPGGPHVGPMNFAF